MEVFKRSFPDKDIMDKSYHITMVRHILMYFLYLEKRRNRSLKYDDIAKIFGCDSSSVCKAVKQVKQYNSIQNFNRLGKEKKLFQFFHAKFNRIFYDRK